MENIKYLIVQNYRNLGLIVVGVILSLIVISLIFDSRAFDIFVGLSVLLMIIAYLAITAVYKLSKDSYEDEYYESDRGDGYEEDSYETDDYEDDEEEDTSKYFKKSR